MPGQKDTETKKRGDLSQLEAVFDAVFHPQLGEAPDDIPVGFQGGLVELIYEQDATRTLRESV